MATSDVVRYRVYEVGKFSAAPDFYGFEIIVSLLYTLFFVPVFYQN